MTKLNDDCCTSINVKKHRASEHNFIYIYIYIYIYRLAALTLSSITEECEE